jgi:hypothetical protein
VVRTLRKDADFKVVQIHAVLLPSVFRGAIPWGYQGGLCVIEPDCEASRVVRSLRAKEMWPHGVTVLRSRYREVPVMVLCGNDHHVVFQQSSWVVLQALLAWLKQVLTRLVPMKCVPTSSLTSRILPEPLGTQG